MNPQLKPLVVRVLVAGVSLVMMWRFGVEVDKDQLAPAMDMLASLAFGWLVFQRPGDTKKPTDPPKGVAL